MSRNHVFLCHIDNVKNIKRDAAAKGEREKIAKTRQLIFFFVVGMAAINAVLETLKSGDHVLASNKVLHVYYLQH